MKKPVSIFVATVTTLLTTDVLATNGFYSHGFSPKDKGTAGAGVARGNDSITTAINPASLIQVGDRMDLGLSMFNPRRSYTVEGEPSLPEGFSPVIGGFPGCAEPGVAPCQIPFSINTQTIDSGREYFFIPTFGYSTKLDDKSVMGVALYGNGGMNTTYSGGSARVFDPNSNTIVNAPGTFGSGKTGVDLAQVFVNLTYAYKFNDKLDVGISAIGALQAFEAYGFEAFANVSTDPTRLSGNGRDFAIGWGFKFGANYHISDKLTLGASYQTEISMSELDEYAGLFAKGGNFDLPTTFSIGIAWETTPRTTFLLDFQGIQYTDVPSIANPIGNLFNGQCVDALNNTLFSGTPSPATGPGCLGGENGAGFGWDNMHIIKAGYEWNFNGDIYRFGYSTTTQPISESEVNLNLVAPGVVEDHFTLGYSTLWNGKQITLFMMYAPKVTVSGQSALDPSQTISFEMDQFEFGFSIEF